MIILTLSSLEGLTRIPYCVRSIIHAKTLRHVLLVVVGPLSSIASFFFCIKSRYLCVFQGGLCANHLFNALAARMITFDLNLMLDG